MAKNPIATGIPAWITIGITVIAMVAGVAAATGQYGQRMAGAERRLDEDERALVTHIRDAEGRNRQRDADLGQIRSDIVRMQTDIGWIRTRLGGAQ